MTSPLNNSLDDILSEMRQNVHDNLNEYAAAFMKKHGLVDPTELIMKVRMNPDPMGAEQTIWFERNPYPKPLEQLTLIEPDKTELGKYTAIMKDMMALNKKMTNYQKAVSIENNLAYRLTKKRLQDVIEFFKTYVIDETNEGDGGFDYSKGPLTQKDIDEYGLNEKRGF